MVNFGWALALALCICVHVGRSALQPSPVSDPSIQALEVRILRDALAAFVGVPSEPKDTSTTLFMHPLRTGAWEYRGTKHDVMLRGFDGSGRLYAILQPSQESDIGTIRYVELWMQYEFAVEYLKPSTIMVECDRAIGDYKGLVILEFNLGCYRSYDSERLSGSACPKHPSAEWMFPHPTLRLKDSYPQIHVRCHSIDPDYPLY